MKSNMILQITMKNRGFLLTLFLLLPLIAFTLYYEIWKVYHNFYKFIEEYLLLCILSIST